MCHTNPGQLGHLPARMANVALVTAIQKPDLEPHGKRLSDNHEHVDVRMYFNPPDIYTHVADAGAAKPRNKWIQEIVLGVLAGCYIGFGFSLCMIVGGQLKVLKTNDPGLFNIIFGGIGFPFGLTMVVVCGASLFTSNCTYMMAAWSERKSTFLQLVRVWVVSYFANFCGSLLLAQLMTWGDVFKDREEFTLQLALKKTSHPFGVTLVKGLLANWLVNLAVWQANAANDITGKAIAIWLPISAFVAMGLEHCVANQFLIPLSTMIWTPEYAGRYEKISISRFLGRNLVPATIGNILGGAIFVGGFYALAFGSCADQLEQRVSEWLQHTKLRNRNSRQVLMHATTVVGRHDYADQEAEHDAV